MLVMRGLPRLPIRGGPPFKEVAMGIIGLIVVIILVILLLRLLA
jgi:hypothetical protein